jgi:hypothetical protein
MKAPREWDDHRILHETVLDALDRASDPEGPIGPVYYGEGNDGYGGRGYVQIKTPDGRIFSLDLYEIL